MTSYVVRLTKTWQPADTSAGQSMLPRVYTNHIEAAKHARIALLQQEKPDVLIVAAEVIRLDDGKVLEHWCLTITDALKDAPDA